MSENIYKNLYVSISVCISKKKQKQITITYIKLEKFSLYDLYAVLFHHKSHKSFYHLMPPTKYMCTQELTSYFNFHHHQSITVGMSFFFHVLPENSIL